MLLIWLVIQCINNDDDDIIIMIKIIIIIKYDFVFDDAVMLCFMLSYFPETQSIHLSFFLETLGT